MDFNESDETILNIAKENSLSFSQHCLKHGNVEDFLHRSSEDYLVTRNVNVAYGEQMLLLDCKHDIDGAVLELTSLNAIKFNVYYLNILPRDTNSLVPMYNILKKHLNINLYSQSSQQLLKMSYGIQLFSGSGWQINLVLLPEANISQRYNIPRGSGYRELAFKYFSALKSKFKESLLNLPPRELCRDSMKKNSLFNVSTWRILSKDQTFILNILDEALRSCNLPRFHIVLPIAFRFGERYESSMNIDSEFDVNQISALSTHVAVTYSSTEGDFHLFWSRDGIQQVVGNRGTLNPALSFRECCNFQTNLDGRPIDISGDLKNICRNPESIHFLQLYADSPHMYCGAKHPVSGLIGTCGLLHCDTTSHLYNLSEKYLSVSRENCTKLVGIISIRLEVVVAMNVIPTEIKTADILSTQHLQKLMEKFPLVVPFQEHLTIAANEIEFSSFLRDISVHIYQTLLDLRNTNLKLGSLLPTWRAYQYELCNELLWWGKLNCHTDSILSANLGPGDGKNNRSVTCRYGFLCLEPSTECALDEHSPPPLNHWTKNIIQQQRIKRLFTFGDFLRSNDVVLGTRAMMVLVEDLKSLKDENETIPSLLSDLRQRNVPSWGECVGSITANRI